MHTKKLKLSFLTAVGFLSSVLLAINGCATTRVVKPLSAKQWAAGADFGGAIIDFAGTKIPLPLTSLTAAYGVDSQLTAFASVHTTSLVAGVVQLELGAVRSVSKKDIKGFNFSAGAVANIMVSTWDGKARLYPEIDLNAYYTYGTKKRNYLYFSLANWFDLQAIEAHHQPNEEHWIPNLALGHTFKTAKMRYTLETRWLAPLSSNQNLVVGYNGIANQGSLAVYFSIFRTF
jgi:hypothetical protein